MYFKLKHLKDKFNNYKWKELHQKDNTEKLKIKFLKVKMNYKI